MPTLFFFNDTATTEIYTLSLHDALPISHLGLSRTYQIITLFSGDTLEHNVTLGLLGLRPSRWQMWRPLSFYGDLATEARRTLDAVGLLHLAEHPVSDIAYCAKVRVRLAMAQTEKPH